MQFRLSVTFSYLLFLYLILWQSETACSQNADLLADSLKSEIRKQLQTDPSADTLLVEEILNVYEAYRFSNLDSAYKYADMALQFSEKTGYMPGMLKSYYSVGTIYFNKGEYDKVQQTGTQALALIENDRYPAYTARINQLIGLSHASQGRYEPGLRYFMQAKTMFDRAGDDLGSFQNLNNIGVSYLKTENYKRALEIFTELDSLRTLDASTISVPVNLGFIYYELNKPELAEQQLRRVLNFEGENFDRRAIALASFKLGEIYKDREEYDRALSYYRRSNAEYDRLNNSVEKVPGLNGIAITYARSGNMQQALEYAREAYRIAEENASLPQLRSSSETLFTIHESNGNFREALRYHKEYSALSDSLLNSELSEEIGRLEAEFEFQKREIELMDRQQQIRLENERKLADQKNITIGLSALLILALVTAFLLYRMMNIRKKAISLLETKNAKIRNQAAELEKTNRMKTHLFSIISHDLKGPLSSLYAFITLHEMDALEKEDIDRVMPELLNRFKYTSNLLNNLLNWARSQLEGFRVNPENINVHSILSDSISVLKPRAADKNIEISVELDPDLKAYADPNMIKLIFLNLVSNAIKFTSSGGRVRITGSEEGKQTEVCITDNGVGIPEEKLNQLFDISSIHTTKGTESEKGTGLGLMLCNDFVRRNGGRLRAESKPGKGSTFCISLPSAGDSADLNDKGIR